MPATDAAVVQEIEHLHEAMLLMKQTRGLCNRLTLHDRTSYPTLSTGILEILQDERVMSGNMIPVGRLFSPDLLFAPNAERIPSRRLRPQHWPTGVYFGTLLVVWLAGVIRIVRILYLTLWKPAYVGTQPDAETASRAWRKCSLVVTMAGLTAVAATLLLFWTIQKMDNDQSIVHPEQFRPSISMVNYTVSALLTCGAVIAACGVFSRPILRGTGWWIGMTGAILALLVLPLNMLTFPTGLAAWIMLTDEQVRQSFAPATRDSADAPTVTA